LIFAEKKVMKQERLSRLKRSKHKSFRNLTEKEGCSSGDGSSGESKTEGDDGNGGNQMDGLLTASPAHGAEGKGSPLHAIDARLDVEMVCIKGEGREDALEEKEKKASFTPREEWGEEEIEGDDGKSTSDLASVMKGAFFKAFAGEEVAVDGAEGGVVGQGRGRGGSTARPARKKDERKSDESVILSDNDDDNLFVGNDGDIGDDVSSFIINDSDDDGSDVESITTPRDYATQWYGGGGGGRETARWGGGRLERRKTRCCARPHGTFGWDEQGGEEARGVEVGQCR
jgi:hypothetical protein